MVDVAGAEATFLQRIGNVTAQGCVFLFGAALVAPAGDGSGVPGVDGIVKMIRERYTQPDDLGEFEAHLRTGKENPYQAAFSHLHRTHGPDEVGRVIREAFLRARTSLDAALTGAAVQGDEQVCRDLENDLAGWHVSAAVFGNSRKPLEVQYPQLLARIDFTPAVIPVTREFLEMAGLRPYSVYPDLDHLAKEVTDSNIPAPVTRSPRANRSRRKTPC